MFCSKSFIKKKSASFLSHIETRIPHKNIHQKSTIKLIVHLIYRSFPTCFYYRQPCYEPSKYIFWEYVPWEIHFPFRQKRNFDSESSSNVTSVPSRSSPRNNQNCFREAERCTSPKRILVLSGHAKRIFSWLAVFCSSDQKFDSQPCIKYHSTLLPFSSPSILPQLR